METTLFTKCLFEFIGTLVLLLMGVGACCANTLEKSKAKGAGWLAVTIGWGLAVMLGVFIAGPYSGAHLNPAVTLAFAVAGSFPWGDVLPYIVAQMLGGFCGAGLAYLFYRDHFNATLDNPDGLLGVFCTMPAIEHKTVNLFSEVVATFILVFVIMALGNPENAVVFGGKTVGAGSFGAFPTGGLIMAIGLSLGATTGYALNPARDLGPRIVHALIPHKNKRDSGWGYSWIPVFGPMLGAVLAAGLYLLVY